MADVFISYKRLERERVAAIASALEAEELSVWFDARLEVGGSDGFDAEIEREVNQARAVVVCWTQEATQSVYVRAEAKKGLERQVLVPVMLSPCVLPVPFNDIDSVDLSHWSGDTSDSAWRRVCERVHKLRSHDRVRKDNDEWKAVRAPLHPGMLAQVISKRYFEQGFNNPDGTRNYSTETLVADDASDLIASLEFAKSYLASVREYLEWCRRKGMAEGEARDRGEFYVNAFWPNFQKAFT
jgi:TIR domain